MGIRGKSEGETITLRLRDEVLTWDAQSLGDVEKRTGIAKANLSRWTREYVPKASELLRLASCLDVDPVALLDAHPATLTTVGRTLALRLVERPDWLRIGRVTSLIPLVARYLLGLDAEYPPDGIFDHKARRPWHRMRYEHRAATGPHNVWLRIQVTTTHPRREHPQLWHFAWRDRFREENLVGQSWWKPYGIILCHGGAVRLEHHNGQRYVVGGVDRTFVVETWLGDSDADFVVASLHPFDSVCSPAMGPADPALPIVRFGAGTPGVVRP